MPVSEPEPIDMPHHPIGFMADYVRRHWAGPTIVLAPVILAAG